MENSIPNKKILFFTEQERSKPTGSLQKIICLEKFTMQNTNE
jgi:hypothetical protein